MKLLTVISAIAGLAGSAMGGDLGSGLVVLNRSQSAALNMVGNSRVLVTGPAVFVNSNSNSAVETDGTAILDADFLYVVGGANFSGRSLCTGPIIRSCSPYSDPFCNFNVAMPEGTPDHGARSISGGTVQLQPGYYSGGVSISGNAEVTLSPGTYWFGGSGFRVTSGRVHGDCVGLVMLSGPLEIAGTSELRLSPQIQGDMALMVVFQPTTNTSRISLSGGSNFLIRGQIYAPNALTRLVGTSLAAGQTQGPQMGDLVVSDRVELAGTSMIRIGVEGAQAISLPKMPLYD